ncbi:MAG: FKBP-type peptidyl-prolyl cis-trans isomerase [Verrucomicrobiales bacterium]|nr:FKBP-type peptidyl-prolyl cis-trans isomerase [Verrucomicrobiales bacterium]
MSKQALEAGRAFLAENGQRPGIITTESGLQYEVLTEGHGESPTLAHIVEVHYRGTLLNGAEFDSSYARFTPAEFPLKRVIKGWKEGLQTMKEGGKTRFFIPTELAYGKKGSGIEIGPNEALIFEVELLRVIEPL